MEGPCYPAVNTAVVNNAVDQNGDPVPAVQDGADVVTQAEPPQVDLDKIWLAPPSGAAYVGDTITYSLRVTNTGPNAITSLVLTDTYNSACITLTSWTISPTQVIAGRAVWNKLIPPQPPLFPGSR